jgi:CBS domain-containing protein
MLNQCHTYQDLKDYKDHVFYQVAEDNFQLNFFHDQIIQKVVHLAEKKINSLWPAPFPEYTFFITGSGGRIEQSFQSDQDHGMVLIDQSESSREYYQELGNEIREGLFQVGYERCDGNVMCSNPYWSRSLHSWKQQLASWFERNDWESIRHLLILFDSRTIVGPNEPLTVIKDEIFHHLQQSPELLNRIVDNTLKIKKSIGVFGHFLVEHHGPYSGTINIKETAFFPYANAIRLLAMKENILDTSTLARFEKLSKESIHYQVLQPYNTLFRSLLDLRFSIHQKNLNLTYESSHYIKVSSLTADDKKKLKEILQGGHQLYQIAKKLMDRGRSPCE